MNKFIITTLFTLTCLPSLAFAGVIDTNPTSPPNQNAITWKITNPLRAEIGDDVSSIIKAIMGSIVMPLASILVVLAILYSGFKFVVAQGNPKELEDARRGLIWVLVGSAILLGAYGISEVLETTIQQIAPIP